MWWQKSGPRDLSGNVGQSLNSQFVIEPLVLGRLRYMDKGGKIGGDPVRFLRIFDPTLIPNGSTVAKYTDLDGYKAALLFEGQSGNDGFGKWYATFRQIGDAARFATRSG